MNKLLTQVVILCIDRKTVDSLEKEMTRIGVPFEILSERGEDGVVVYQVPEFWKQFKYFKDVGVSQLERKNQEHSITFHQAAPQNKTNI